MIGPSQRTGLLKAAREAIAASLGRSAVSDRTADLPEQSAGAFVTLRDTSTGALRGCIGHIAADRPLSAVVASCAVAAARDDPRFDPVTPAEFATLAIEISVLGPFEPVHELGEIEIGRHGLLAEGDRRRGLLLPQVASERGWDAAALVAHTCEKAGLPRDGWPSPGVRLWRFTAEVFDDEAPRPAGGGS